MRRGFPPRVPLDLAPVVLFGFDPHISEDALPSVPVYQLPSTSLATRDSKCFVSVSMAVTGRDAAYEGPLMHCGARLSATGCRPGGCF